MATEPKDFASYLLAILIVNGLIYLLFYVVMKVIIIKYFIYSEEVTLNNVLKYFQNTSTFKYFKVLSTLEIMQIAEFQMQFFMQ